jgi:hypothetical protein
MLCILPLYISNFVLMLSPSYHNVFSCILSNAPRKELQPDSKRQATSTGKFYMHTLTTKIAVSILQLSIFLFFNKIFDTLFSGLTSNMLYICSFFLFYSIFINAPAGILNEIGK